MKWTRIDTGRYSFGDYEIERASIRYAGRYPWIVFFKGKRIDSRSTLEEAKRVAMRCMGLEPPKVEKIEDIVFVLSDVEDDDRRHTKIVPVPVLKRRTAGVMVRRSPLTEGRTYLKSSEYFEHFEDAVIHYRETVVRRLADKLKAAEEDLAAMRHQLMGL